MVTPLASRPAALTQRQVDDFSAGRHVDRATVLHVARSTPPVSRAASAKVADGSRPVDLTPKDLETLAQGSVPAALAKRIAAATPAEPVASGKAKAGAGKRKAVDGAQPSIDPPGVKKR